MSRLLFLLPILTLFLFQTNSSKAQTLCNISDLTAVIVDQNPNTCQYYVKLNFQHTGTTNQFTVKGNGTTYGTFPYGQLPLILGPFTATSQPTVREFLVADAVFGDCKDDVVLTIPACNAAPFCNIVDFVVDPGTCTSDSTYSLSLNFSVLSAAVPDSFDVWANGSFYSRFGMNQLPLTIQQFPWNGGAFDVVKVCLKPTATFQGCCADAEFVVPDCLPYEGCEVSTLKIKELKCTSDSTIGLILDFQVANPNSVSTFTVMANSQMFGPFTLAQLPLTIANFPWNGNVFQKIRVCTGNAPVCCREQKFIAPSCLPFGPCEVFDISVTPGACTGPNTYKVNLNFQATNPGNGEFTVWGNGQQLGVFPFSALPLTLNNFPSNGSAIDVVKICIKTPPGTASCCKEKEFQGTDCVNPQPCSIFDLTVLVGDCNNDGTYKVKIDFHSLNATSDFFEVWNAAGQSQGIFPLSALPLTLNFPDNGQTGDAIKVCFKNNTMCCAIKQFLTPDCPPSNCEISGLQVTTGDCHNDGTYKITINFQVQNATNDFFEVWNAAGQSQGIFLLSALPLVLNFPDNGLNFDAVKVCIKNNTNCCAVKEFQVPNCPPSGCEIFDLTVQVGDCINDSTYKIKINFQVVNSPNALFEVWSGTGQYLGFYPLTSLPLVLEFPASGQDVDAIKVCINDAPNCCKVKEFAAPDCITPTDCKIYDLHVLKTPCVCGQFFALLWFGHEDTGSGGFDVMGNGVNYGNFPYSTPQPIILGPLVGDGITSYEFVVKDHLMPTCKDDVELGKVTCSTNTDDLPDGPGAVTVAPNPASSWISVSAKLTNGKPVGQANMELYAADGKLALSQSLADASSFSLDVSSLPSGTWRIVLFTAMGRLETSFVKQ